MGEKAHVEVKAAGDCQNMRLSKRAPTTPGRLEVWRGIWRDPSRSEKIHRWWEGGIPIDDLESLLMGIQVPLDLPLETLP